MTDYRKEWEKKTGNHDCNGIYTLDYLKAWNKHLETLLAERDAKLTAIRGALMTDEEIKELKEDDDDWYYGKAIGIEEQRTRIQNILDK